ncbi:hypothetical protein JCM10212_006630 [Sporobolomyces blumeae]
MSMASPSTAAGAAAADASMPIPDLNAISGPFIIGTMLAMLLQGVTLHQGTVFWIGCKKAREPLVYMAIVALMQVLDVIHTGFCINTIYEWCVRNFGNPATLAISPFSFMVEPAMAAVSATIVHSFYAHRILLIADGHLYGKISAVGIIVFSTVQCGFGIAVTQKIVEYDYEFERFIAWLWGACVWLGTLAVTDLIICASYTYFLNRTAKDMSGPFVHSTQMILKVALIVLATNGCSAAVAVIATVLFGGLHNANWHAIPQLCLQKMLTLSLLVCLNARTLLSDMIGLDPDLFRSHMKRQMPYFTDSNAGGPHGANAGMTKFGGGGGGGGGGTSGYGNGRGDGARRDRNPVNSSAVSLGGGAATRSTALDRTNVFDVQIDRVRVPAYTEAVAQRLSDEGDEDVKKGVVPYGAEFESLSSNGSGRGGSGTGLGTPGVDHKAFVDEIGSLSERQPYVRSTSDHDMVHPFSNARSAI